MSQGKPVPRPTPDTQGFWDGTAAGELRVPSCEDCGQAFFPPRAVCPRCASTAWSWSPVSGRARLHSYTLVHRPMAGFEDDAPYAVAVVELDEGPRMMAGLVDVPQDPEHLVLDMELELALVPRGDMQVPGFRPRQVVS